MLTMAFKLYLYGIEMAMPYSAKTFSEVLIVPLWN